jgi:WD40 repeat protein
MIRDGKLQVHYKEIPERIRRWFGGRIEDDRELDYWDYDLRNQTLLHRDAAGYYEFAHKSLAEFFVAVKFATELGGLHENVLSTYREVQGQPNRSLEHESGLDQLVQTFGFFASRDERIKAAWNFLPWLLEPKRVKERLVELILSCRNRHAADCGFVAGNSLTILQEFGLTTAPDGKTFRGADLSFLPLSHAHFSPFHSADFSNASLKGSDLSCAEIPLPILQKADLRNASCKQMRLGGRGSTMRTWVLGFDDVLGATRVVQNVQNGIPILSLHWHQGGTLFAGAMDGTIREWPDEAGAEAYFCPGIPAWIEDVRRHWQDPDGWILWSREGVYSWDSIGTARKLVAPVLGRAGLLSAIDNGGRHLLSWKDEGALALHDLDSGQELLRTPADLRQICAVALNYESNIYAAGTTDGCLLVWRELGKSATTHILKPGIRISAIHIADSPQMLFAAGLEEREGRFFLNLWAWDLDTERNLWHKSERIFNPRAIESDINERVSLRHNEATGLLAVATGDMDAPVRLIEGANGTPVCRLRECPKVQAVAFNPQKPQLAIGHDHGSVSIWDCDQSSATFATCLRILDVRLNAQGLASRERRDWMRPLFGPDNGSRFKVRDSNF